MSHGHEDDTPKTYAMVAEFESADQLMAAAEKTRDAGFKQIDCYTPFPVHGLSEAMGFRDARVPWFIFAGGLIGGLTGYTLQWYTAVIDYPLNVGGKPLNSIPAFFPVTFECTILFAGITAFLSVLVTNRLPKPYHSIFNTPGFERASQDRFFLEIGTGDPQYDSRTTRDFMDRLGAVRVSEVME
ncbi:MAG TPA: DUF3341 domain-containing protein [Fimbriimonas sp.]|nr:DUF3341 domain-containing protein [Fimbriimonas sp.]